nr:MAG TPA: hypothetical protein [Caudoviricetes sp.]
MNPVPAKIPNINTGFWLKILIDLQRVIHEIANSKLIDVIYNTPQSLYYILL